MFRRLLVIPTRGIKHTVPIKWVRPEAIPAYKPARSGDLEPRIDVPPDTLGHLYSLSEEIKHVPESVKKLFSVAFLGRKEQNALVKLHLMDRVRRHKYDEATAETRIARITGQIRNLQETMDLFPKNVKTKKVVQELIDKRKKLLKWLRQYDYKKFEWLLEKLNLEYKAHPDSHHKLSRRESLHKLTEMHCDGIRQKKLDEYRSLLESQQGPFLRDKIDTLNFIRKEQQELQMPITVTDQEIKKFEKLLEEWTVKDNIKKQAIKKKKHVVFD